MRMVMVITWEPIFETCCEGDSLESESDVEEVLGANDQGVGLSGILQGGSRRKEGEDEFCEEVGNVIVSS